MFEFLCNVQAHAHVHCRHCRCAELHSSPYMLLHTSKNTICALAKSSSFCTTACRVVGTWNLRCQQTTQMGYIVVCEVSTVSNSGKKQTELIGISLWPRHDTVGPGPYRDGVTWRKRIWRIFKYIGCSVGYTEYTTVLSLYFLCFHNS